ncbi:GntR family transcriptional regulator [Rhodococcus sp. UNC23MFCrub1.1]|uniref:GntR family transcriptional regulator n=1 Tax=Rhodococcus sp. UNC23MFCrub1.1 TaxID=1449068 RepID=UPI0009DF6783|nr:GntR family transcriptional regulator [Rhodococcus sp. UNC23MFCrub1.1]
MTETAVGASASGHDQAGRCAVPDEGSLSLRRRTRIPLVDELTELIRERIYSQRYVTGQWLRQEKLSEEFDVSRTPLREALRRLEQEGLIKSEPGKGARVISGDAGTLLSAYELRAVVDGLAAKLAARDATATRVRDLRKTIEAQRESLDPWSPRSYSKLNVEFHELVAHMSGNEFVVAQTSIIKLTAQVFAPVSVLDPSSALRAVDEHVAITDAIEARDSPNAERIARAHIERTIIEIRARVKLSS